MRTPSIASREGRANVERGEELRICIGALFLTAINANLSNANFSALPSSFAHRSVMTQGMVLHMARTVGEVGSSYTMNTEEDNGAPITEGTEVRGVLRHFHSSLKKPAPIVPFMTSLAKNHTLFSNTVDAVSCVI